MRKQAVKQLALGSASRGSRAAEACAWASALYGDLDGLPLLFLEVGDCEILLDDTRRFAAKARQAGVDVTEEVWPEMFHVWHDFSLMLPEAREAIEHIGEFIRQHA